MESTRRDFLMQTAGSLAAFAIVPEMLSRASVLAQAGPVNVGLIGCGRHGRAIISELAGLENVKLVAVCDTQQSRADGAAKRVQPNAEAFTDHRAMLEKRKDLSAVIVATPTHLHAAPAVDSVAAGLHVYCEAPLAHSIAECGVIAKAARGSKKVFQVGHLGRANPIYKLARKFFRSDSVRDIAHAEAQWYQKTSWRQAVSDPSRDREANWRLDEELSTGLAGEQGSHQFDVVDWYTEEIPVSIYGGGSIRLHNDGRKVPDTISLLMRFKKGWELSYNASLANSFQGVHEIFRGTNAAIKLGWTHGWMFKEADAPTQGWEVYANRQQFHKDEGITLIADATKLASQGKLAAGVGLERPSLYYGLWEFFMSIAEGKAPVCDIDAGHRSAVLSILANQAILKSGEVKVDEAVVRGA